MALSKEASAIIEMWRSQQMQNDSMSELQVGQKAADYNIPQPKADKAESMPVQAENAGTTMYVRVANLNVRKGIGKNYSKIGALKAGDAVNVLETAANGWCRISFRSGYGWVCGKYLSDKAAVSKGKVVAHKPAGSANNSAKKGASGNAADAVKFAENMINSTKYYEVRRKSNGKISKMTKCQAFVADATSKAMGFRASQETAALAANAWEISNEMSNIPVGAAVYFYSSTPNGKKCGHVGIHVGNDQIIHVGGAKKDGKTAVGKQSLSKINSNGIHTFRSWGWNGGVKLKQPDDQ